MQISLKKKEGIHCELNIELPADEIDLSVFQRLKKFAKTAKINGFRSGKIPIDIIKRKYGKLIRLEIINEILPMKYSQALKQTKLNNNVAGVEFRLIQNIEKKPLIFNATIELFPTFTIKNLHTMNIIYPIVDINDDDINKMINDLRQECASWNEVDREVKKNDLIVINFIQPIPQIILKKYTKTCKLIIGSNTPIIPYFENKIIGMKKHITNSIKINLSNQLQNNDNDIKTKMININFIITSLKEKHLPQLNDNFFKKFGIINGNLKKFYDHIKLLMERECEYAKRIKIKEQIYKELIKVIEIVEIPQSLIKKELKTIKKNTFNNSNELIQYASNKIKLNLILQQILNEQKFTIDEKKINNFINMFYNDQKIIQKIKNNKTELDHIKNIIIEDQIIDWIMQQCKKIDKKINFFDLNNNNMLFQAK